MKNIRDYHICKDRSKLLGKLNFQWSNFYTFFIGSSVIFCLIHCSMSLKCSGLYLYQFRRNSPQLLASGDGTKSATIVGDVYVHPSAKIHPSAKVVLFHFMSD